LDSSAAIWEKAVFKTESMRNVTVSTFRAMLIFEIPSVLQIEYLNVIRIASGAKDATRTSNVFGSKTIEGIHP
jgi:hypothetical protein